MGSRPSRARLALLLLALALVVIGAVVGPRIVRSTSDPVNAPPPSKLTTKNSAGRDGAYFLPRGYTGQKLPLLVAIHGQGSSGASMVDRLHDVAERERLIVVAPDSRLFNGEVAWEVNDTLSDPKTGDFTHVQRCVQEVLAMPGVDIDRAHVLIAGHSAGGSTAPLVASWDDLYTAFAVLHGGVFVGGLGPNKVRGWFSTGTGDRLRPVLGVQAAAEGVRRAGFNPVEVHTYPGGHAVSDAELRELISWWLGR